MTDEQLEALGRRWIAKGGDVRPGMMICDFEGALRVIAKAAPGRLYVAGRMALDTWTVEETDWIDLSDGATKGAALEVVRERWGDPLATVALFMHNPPRWCVVNGRNNAQVFNHAPTEEEALVAALEAAPKVTP